MCGEWRSAGRGVGKCGVRWEVCWREGGNVGRGIGEV